MPSLSSGWISVFAYTPQRPETSWTVVPRLASCSNSPDSVPTPHELCHLVDKCTGTACARAVHAHVGNLDVSLIVGAEEDHLGVLAAQLDGAARLRIEPADRERVGDHLLNVRGAQRGRDIARTEPVTATRSDSWGKRSRARRAWRARSLSDTPRGGDIPTTPRSYPRASRKLWSSSTLRPVLLATP